MKKFEVGSVVKALSASDTWMHQFDVAGTITEIFQKDGKDFAKISVPKWYLTKNFGSHVIREWVREGWSKSEDDFLLLDEGIELAHLEPSEMPEWHLTIENRVDSLINQAFGFKNNRLGINVIYYPDDLAVTPGICVHEGCDQPRTHLAWNNNHGTVEAFMVCEPHYKECNGRCSDGFHLKAELSRKAA
ncbi:MAG: hypothetical protein WC791_02635 [Candidatus Paceibacterota bacterium]|jgi:hypothetical protein